MGGRTALVWEGEQPSYMRENSTAMGGRTALLCEKEQKCWEKEEHCYRMDNNTAIGEIIILLGREHSTYSTLCSTVRDHSVDDYSGKSIFFRIVFSPMINSLTMNRLLFVDYV